MAKLVSQVYGEALFASAKEQKQLETLGAEVRFVKEMLEEHEDLKKLLLHPKLSREEKIEVVRTIFMGRVSDILTGFLVTVTEKDRQSELPAIFAYFEDRLREEKGIGAVVVASAMALRPSQKMKIEQRLKETTQFKSLEVQYEIKPELIGGITVTIGDRVVDGSIRTRLYRMERDLRKLQISG